MWNFEAGEKFDGFNHRLQINVSGFLDRYTDLQIVSFNQTTLSANTTNAGSAYINGFEAQAQAAPTGWLTVGASWDHLWSKFTNYIVNNGPGVPASDYTGNQVPYVAPDRVTLNGDLHFPIGADAGRISLGADWSWRNEMWFDAANSAPDFLRSLTAWHGLLDGHVLWTSENDIWEVEVWGKNLTNTLFITQGAELTFLLETPEDAANPNLHDFFVTPNPPRTFGVTMRRRF